MSCWVSEVWPSLIFLHGMREASFFELQVTSNTIVQSEASATVFGAQGHQTCFGQGEYMQAHQRDVGG